MNASATGSTGLIVVVGAGYAGLHVALRLTANQRQNRAVPLTLIDRNDHDQVITELPRVAGGTRAADAVRIPLHDTLSKRAHFVLTEIDGFDLDSRRLLRGPGPSAGAGWYRPSAAGPTTSPSPAWRTHPAAVLGQRR